jgi:CheY-like chemotaxis protein
MSPAADVLVVNDRMLDAQATLVALEFVAPRARVLHLDSGQQALQYLFATGEFHGRPAKPPGLMLLTLELEIVSGLCVLDFVRAHPATAKIPVVLLSLEGDVRKYRRNNQFDASAYIAQPCDFHRYCAVLRGCIRHWLPWAERPGSAAVPLTDSTTLHYRSQSNDPHSAFL